MVFNANTQNKQDRRLCSIRILLCCSFFSQHGHAFSSQLPTLCFLFDCPCCGSLFNCLVSSYLGLRLPIRAGRQKGSHSFFSGGFQSTTSHYSSSCVCWLLCEMSLVGHNIFWLQQKKTWRILVPFQNNIPSLQWLFINWTLLRRNTQKCLLDIKCYYFFD